MESHLNYSQNSYPVTTHRRQGTEYYNDASIPRRQCNSTMLKFNYMKSEYDSDSSAMTPYAHRSEVRQTKMTSSASEFHSSNSRVKTSAVKGTIVTGDSDRACQVCGLQFAENECVFCCSNCQKLFHGKCLNISENWCNIIKAGPPNLHFFCLECLEQQQSKSEKDKALQMMSNVQHTTSDNSVNAMTKHMECLQKALHDCKITLEQASRILETNCGDTPPIEKSGKSNKIIELYYAVNKINSIKIHKLLRIKGSFC